VGLLWRLVPRETPLWIAVAASAAFFLVVILLARLSYLYIEKPVLRYRRPYLTSLAQPAPTVRYIGIKVDDALA
jgi:peptidoglycan/LPS O-acetylase OafA/YrhL